MKSLYLVRHAKSSWKDFEILSDFERPLNKRGKRDAPFMGNILYEKGIFPNLLLSSPALRAHSTAIAIAQAIQYPIEKIQLEQAIYEASTLDLLTIIQKLDDKHRSVMLFGHNPGFTLLANILGADSLDNLPTCGIICFQFDAASWREAKTETAQLLWFEYPKLYFK